MGSPDHRKVIAGMVVALLAAAAVSAQTDTLLIGRYKYALHKTKLFYNVAQRGFPYLPSEYSETPRHETVISYHCCDSVEYFRSDNALTQVLNPDTQRGNLFLAFHTIVDTITLSKGELAWLHPQIRSRSGIYFVSSAMTYRFQNDTLTRASYATCDLSLDLDLGISGSLAQTGQLTFVLTDLYYRKKETTFFLDKSFVLKIGQ